MQRLYIICLVIFVVSKVNAQVKVNNEKSFNPHFIWDINYIDSLYHLEKNNDFELRFFANTYIGKMKIFILVKKNNNWNARYFESIKDSSVRMIEKEISKENLSLLWDSLSKKGVLKIPASENLKDIKGEPLYANIIHGTVFYFDLLTLTLGNSYSYHCPAGYVKEFPNVKEYKKVLSLVQIIFNFCQIKFRIC